ncbi:hypothetical protein ACFLV2_02510 [Chloroflexota bacterium]
MADEKKVEPGKAVEALEDEFKLIKGELKETLSSVRDYLLNSELPASEYSAILQALGGGATSTMSGKLSIDKDAFLPQPPPPPAEEPHNEASDAKGSDGSGGSGAGGGADEGTEYIEEDEPIDLDEPAMAEPKMSEEAIPEEMPMEMPASAEESYSPRPELTEPAAEYRPAMEDPDQSTPKVNLLANLTHWVANAKRELGSEQLPAFLEVYGISGHLSPELKEIIIHLADITSEGSQEASVAEIWSKLMLELHGILTGGDAPLHPVRPFWGEEETAQEEPEVEEKPKKPMKLKLVLSNGEEDKEFSLNLDPAED